MHALAVLCFLLIYEASPTRIRIEPITYSAEEEKGKIWLTFHDDQFDVKYSTGQNETGSNGTAMDTYGTLDVYIPFLDINCEGVPYKIVQPSLVLIEFVPHYTLAAVSESYEHRNFTLQSGMGKIEKVLSKSSAKCIMPLKSDSKETVYAVFIYDASVPKITFIFRRLDSPDPSEKTLYLARDNGINIPLFVGIGVAVCVAGGIITYILVKKKGKKQEPEPAKEESTVSTRGRALE